MVFNGGGDMELGIEPARVVYTENGSPCLYDSQNGRTFFVDHILHDPVKNVYTVLGEHEEFSRFFELCMGDEQVSTNFIDDEDFVDIFGTKYSKEAKICGIGHVVTNFNNYRYTILVPTNEALDAAYELNRLDGILPALESAHALGALHRLKFRPDDVVVMTLSGRGDKDIATYMEHARQ